MSIEAAEPLAEATAEAPSSAAVPDQAGAEAQLSDAEADAAAAQLLRSFLAAHEARARHYARLHKGFKAMLQSGQEAPYRELLAELTAGFNDVSKQVGGTTRQ